MTFIGLLVVALVRSELGIILKSLESEFGWGRPAITFTLSVNLLLFGLAGPFLGRISITTVILLLIGTTGTLFIQENWHFLIFWGVIADIGSGGISLALFSAGYFSLIESGLQSQLMEQAIYTACHAIIRLFSGRRQFLQYTRQY